MFLCGFVGEHVVPLLLRDVTGKLSVERGSCSAVLQL